jgi:hypothetical protein
MAIPAQTTLLSAVCTILRGINEAPVSSLAPPFTDDVGFALACIDEIQLEVLGHGWSFNSESDLPIVPDIDGKYAIPSDVLQITLDRPSPAYRLVPRDDSGVLRLYNAARGKHTFVLPSGLKATFVYLQDFEDMPEPFRRYVTLRASRAFDARLKNGDASQFSQEEVVQAKKAIRDHECDANRPTVFDNWSAARVLRRGRPHIEGGHW